MFRSFNLFPSFGKQKSILWKMESNLLPSKRINNPPCKLNQLRKRNYSNEEMINLNRDLFLEDQTHTIREPVKKKKEKEAQIGGILNTGKTHRFYKKPTVEYFQNDFVSGWYILLDGRTVKTPEGNRICVPSKQLALVIAAEWDLQGTRIIPSTMPLMGIAATAIDQVSAKRAHLIDSLLSFLRTDTTCCRSFNSQTLALTQKKTT